MKLVIAISVVLMLSACASRPSFDYEPSTIQNVGILIDLDNDLTHTHVGTTVFTNSVNTFPPQTFSPADFLLEQIRSTLNERGYKVVSVDMSEHRGFTERSLLYAGWSGLGVRTENREPLEELIQIEELDILLIFEPFYRQDHIGLTSVRVSGFGLYTRSFMGADSASIYSNVRGCGVLALPVVFIDCGGTSEHIQTEISKLNEDTAAEVEEGVRRLLEKVVEDTVLELGL